MSDSELISRSIVHFSLTSAEDEGIQVPTLFRTRNEVSIHPLSIDPAPLECHDTQNTNPSSNESTTDDSRRYRGQKTAASDYAA
jgi:hypothetical protein